MTQESQNILLFSIPLIIGGIIAAINTDVVNNVTEKIESWTRKKQLRFSQKRGRFSRYIVHPILWVMIQFFNWTDGLSHRGIKNGLRVTIALYLILSWLFLIYAALTFVLALAFALIFIYIVFNMIIGSDKSPREAYKQGKRVVGSVGAGKRVNQETGIIQKETLFGFVDTDQRIDPDTGKLQTKGLFGWVDSDVKIDQETGNIQKDSLFGYQDSDTRIDPETGIIQKNTLLGWQDTDERINPKTGKRQRNTLLGWVDE